MSYVVTGGKGVDFVSESLSEEMRQPRILREVVQAYRERAGASSPPLMHTRDNLDPALRRSCLIFAVDVSHGEALAAAFREVQIPAQCVRERVSNTLVEAHGVVDLRHDRSARTLRYPNAVP